MGTTGENPYGWLFDNTYNCTNWGCNVGTSNDPYGYWTNDYAGIYTGKYSENGTIESYPVAWSSAEDGSISHRPINYSGVFGIRPVIEIDKSLSILSKAMSGRKTGIVTTELDDVILSMVWLATCPKLSPVIIAWSPC